MLVCFFLFVAAVTATEQHYYLHITRYADPTDWAYQPVLLPLCDWPRRQDYANLPLCQEGGTDVLEYRNTTKTLILNILMYKDVQCTLPVQWFKQYLIPQDICNNAYGDWTKMHVLSAPQSKHVHFEKSWRHGPDAGRNVSLQTFHEPFCRDDGPLLQRIVGTCYQRKYFGSYALVDFRNETVLTGMVWNNKNCDGENASWFYVVKQQCSQPTYDTSDGPSSWLGWW